MPGSIYAPQSKGTNRLIQEGAQLFLDVGDVLEALNLAQAASSALRAYGAAWRCHRSTAIWILGREPLHVDEIGAQAGMPSSRFPRR